MHNPQTWTKRGNCWREEENQVEGGKEGEKWDNFNSIVNKIYLKKKGKKETLQSIYFESIYLPVPGHWQWPESVQTDSNWKQEKEPRTQHLIEEANNLSSTKVKKDCGSCIAEVAVDSN